MDKDRILAILLNRDADTLNVLKQIARIDENQFALEAIKRVVELHQPVISVIGDLCSICRTYDNGDWLMADYPCETIKALKG